MPPSIGKDPFCMQLNECCCALALNADQLEMRLPIGREHLVSLPQVFWRPPQRIPRDDLHSCLTRTFLLRTQNGVPANAMCQRQSDQRTKAPWASGAMRLGIVAGMDPHFGMVEPWDCAHPAWQAAPLQIHMPNSFSSHGSVANAKAMRQTCSLSCTNLHEID